MFLAGSASIVSLAHWIAAGAKSPRGLDKRPGAGLELATCGLEDRRVDHVKADAGDTSESQADGLARRLRRDPELTEAVTVWPLLNEPIRQPIVAIVRATPK